MTGALLLSVLAASDVTASVHLEPPVIPYHRQARYTVSAEGPRDANIKLPDMVELFGGLAVYGTPEYSQKTIDDERIRISETYTLDAITTGLYAIAPAVVTWGDNNRVEIPSPALQVRELTPEEVEEAENFDASIAAPDLTEPGLWSRWEFWAAVGLVVLALGALYARLLRAPTTKAAPPPKKPWEIAYERLRILDERHYPEQEEYGPYYVDLSSIIRYYIEDRFHIHAPEQTTQEFLNEATEAHILNEAQQRMLGQFLRHSDRVKFAQYRPTKKEMEESFTRVLEFVDETVPKESSAGKEAA